MPKSARIQLPVCRRRIRPTGGRRAASSSVIPLARSPATSRQNLAIAASSMVPSSPVIDDDPILATMI